MIPRLRPRRTYTLDPDVVRWIEAEAKRTGFKMSAIIELAVLSYRMRQGDKPQQDRR